ncbi:MAG: sensor histidine kinase [Opitutales bacterium]
MSDLNGTDRSDTVQDFFRYECAVLKRAQQADEQSRPSYRELVGEYNRLLRRLIRTSNSVESLERQSVKLRHECFRANEENADLKETLTSTEEEKNHFIGVASHDLRSPLSALYSMVRLMHSEGENLDPEMRQDMLGMASESIERMMGLVEHLLDLNRLERGVQELEFSQVAVADVCRRLVGTLTTQAQSKAIVLEMTFAELPTVRAPERAVDRILENFLSNAIKYSPPETTVRLGADVTDDALEVWVQDQGPGLTEEDRQKLFQPFQRLSAQPTGGESASGLGLAIARKLADSMGAELTVESEAGQGARFGLRLPRQVAARKAAEAVFPGA